ncbi:MULTISPECIES: TetR/AcrR family transcriptional regulator [Sulfitobacter]|uniref:TetR/AcrR family transcriptional regulator n=1 Tax=Sulfitobacter TaxID=60136 RepID=UPI00257F68FD|nr:TetR/AcrR family transcriptional regulator [Sulfitobacter sp. UBA1132]
MVPIIFGPLRTRETPRQSRAVTRVHVILNATAALLAENRLQDLTTTAIATRAEVPVSSIYRYFPTLDDVLLELYSQTANELRAKLFASLDDVHAHTTWRDRLRAVLDVQRSYLARHPYYRPLLLHFATKRGPLAIEDDDHDDLVRFLCNRWESGADGFQGGDPVVVAKTTIQISLAMEDLVAAQADRRSSRPYSQELTKVLEHYLSQYLSD